jgi:hypothetical protein
VSDDVRELLSGRTGPEGVDAASSGTGALEALEVVTADADGWPHIAWLSAGEVLPVGPTTLGMCLWPNSTSTRNLERSGHALLQIVVDGEVWKLRLEVRPLGRIDVDGRALAAFRAEVVDGKRDAVPYADVLTGPSYRLHEPAAVGERWHAQLAELDALIHRA